MKTTASALLLVLSAISTIGASAEEAKGRPSIERTALAERNQDVVHLLDGRLLVGIIEERAADGSIRITERGKPTVQIESSRIVWIDPRGTYADAVVRRGKEAVAERDWADCTDLLRKATAHYLLGKADAGAVRAALVAVAADAVTASGPTVLADGPLQLCWQPPIDALSAERLTAAVLERDGSWEPGLEARVRIAETRQDLASQRAALAAWLERQPSNLAANRRMADVAEATGDLPAAGEALRKCFELHQDVSAGIRLIPVLMRRGEIAKAQQAAVRLQDPAIIAGSPVSAPVALAWLGITTLAMGDAQAAQQQLERALSDGVDGPVKQLARYNLGLIHWRAGRRDEALSRWRDNDLPLASLARAVADERTWSPTTAEMLPWSRQHGAILALRQGDASAVLTMLADQSTSGPAAELVTRATILSRNGDPSSIQPLANRTDDDSRRWVAYGHLLAGRLDQASVTLDGLPQEDGWTLACRVFLAERQGDAAGARRWAGRLAASLNPPEEYLAAITREFTLADSAELIDEPFAWTDGAIGLGWTFRNQGTGMVLGRGEAGIRLSGTQSGHDDARLLRSLPRARLREITVSLNPDAHSGGMAGITLGDGAHQQGLDLVVNAKGQLRWRRLTDGKPGEWTVLADRAAETGPVTLRIAVSGTTYSVGTLAGMHPVPGPVPDGRSLTAGILITAPPDVPVNVDLRRFTAEYGTRAGGSLTSAPDAGGVGRSAPVIR